MIKTYQLKQLQSIVKVHAVAKMAGLNPKYIQVKLHRESELTRVESEKISGVLSEFGIKIQVEEKT